MKKSLCWLTFCSISLPHNQKFISLLFVWVCRNPISFWELQCSLICRHFMSVEKIEGDAEVRNFLGHWGRPAEFLLYEFGKFLWGSCWATTHIDCVLYGESMSPLGLIKTFFLRWLLIKSDRPIKFWTTLLISHIACSNFHGQRSLHVIRGSSCFECCVVVPYMEKLIYVKRNSYEFL